MSFLKKWLFRLGLLVIALIAFLAGADNSSEVSLAFLNYRTPDLPVSWWVLSAFVIGLIFGAMLNTIANTRLKLETRAAKKRVANSNRQLDAANASSTSSD